MELVIGILQRFHIPQPDVLDDRQVVSHHIGIYITDRWEGDLFNLIQLVSSPGGLDVPIDVDLFAFKLVRVHLEALEQSGEGQVGQQNHNDPKAESPGHQP